jgi:lipopolysaccharide transport system permease protein
MLISPMSVLGQAARAINPFHVASSVRAAAQAVIRNRTFGFELAAREMRIKYAGQSIGSAWVLAHPMSQLLLLVFVFGFVFKQRIGGTEELPRDYTTYILSGLVPWLSIVPVFTGACSVIFSHASMVKQFQIDADGLPLKDVFTSFIFWAVGILLIATNVAFQESSLPWTYVLLPVVLVLHFMFAVGVAWALAGISVFMRDVKDFMLVAVQVGIYLLPIVYLPQWVPSMFRPVVDWNPMSAMIWVYQDTLYFGRIEHPRAWGVFALMALLTFALGYRLFVRLKPHFGKVL